LPGQRVHLWTEAGPVSGVIGARHQHVSDPQEAIDLANLYIDIGAASRDQVLNRGIQVGIPVTYAAGFDVLDGRVSGKSLDDRLGCFLLLSLAEQLRSQPLPVDLSLVFVVQEETILTGAVPAIYDLEPDWAIGLDATLAFDTPDLTGGQNDIALGEGTVIKVMDHLRGQGLGFISHLGLRQHVERTAQEKGIRFQREVVTGLSTAATPLPYLRSRLPVAAVSFPLRYAHSPVDMVDVGDAQASLHLLAGLVFQPWDG
jgi:endoglucanase